MKLNILDREVIVDVLYSNRKSMTIDITPECHITVKSPSKASENEIYDFVKSHHKQIFEAMDRIENRIYISSQKTYNDSETFLYLGKPCSLIDILSEVPESEDQTQLMLKRFYTSKTKEIIKKRVKHFEKIIGVKAKSVTVTDSVGTWGTCNSLRELTFNYRLSMAPVDVIDYVVVHELCHIMHLNHDRSFWRKVGSYDPDFKKKQDYLSKFGFVMTI